MQVDSLINLILEKQSSVIFYRTNSMRYHSSNEHGVKLSFLWASMNFSNFTPYKILTFIQTQHPSQHTFIPSSFYCISSKTWLFQCVPAGIGSKTLPSAGLQLHTFICVEPGWVKLCGGKSIRRIIYGGVNASMTRVNMSDFDPYWLMMMMMKMIICILWNDWVKHRKGSGSAVMGYSWV